jgi:hypothetical protein
MVSATEKSNPYMAELKATAKKISGRGRGILARYRNRYFSKSEELPVHIGQASMLIILATSFDLQ